MGAITSPAAAADLLQSSRTTAPACQQAAQQPDMPAPQLPASGLRSRKRRCRQGFGAEGATLDDARISADGFGVDPPPTPAAALIREFRPSGAPLSIRAETYRDPQRDAGLPARKLLRSFSPAYRSGFYRLMVSCSFDGAGCRHYLQGTCHCVRQQTEKPSPRV